MRPLSELSTPVNMTMDQAIFAFLKHCDLVRRLRSATLAAYRFDLQQFERWCLSQSTRCAISDVESVRVINSYLTDKSTMSKISAARLGRIVSTLKSFFKHLHSSGFIESNPMILISKPVIRSRVPVFCNVKECSRLLASVHQSKQRAIVALLLYTGLRVSEVAELRYTDLNFEKLSLLTRGKGGKERRIPFPSVMVPHLMPYISGLEPSGLLFPGQVPGSCISPRTVQRIVSKAARTAGLASSISPHTLRHSYASALIEADTNIVKIQNLLGHESIRTTQIYTHASGKSLRAAADTLNFG